jgi:hypothetical protein
MTFCLFPTKKVLLTIHCLTLLSLAKEFLSLRLFIKAANTSFAEVGVNIYISTTNN